MLPSRRWPLYFRQARAMIIPMDDRKPSGGKEPPQNTDPRRTANLPTGGSKAAAGAENTPKSSADAAIPPEKLNAGNDK
jgi:hypothetical protein